jgi:hypothetical protein
VAVEQAKKREDPEFFPNCFELFSDAVDAIAAVS